MMPTSKNPKRWSPHAEGPRGVNIYSYSDDEKLYGQVTRDAAGGWNAFAYGQAEKPARIGHFQELAEAKQAVEEYFSQIGMKNEVTQ